MKITINEKTENKEITFPCLLESKNNKGFIIYAMGEGDSTNYESLEGFCLSENNYPFKQYSTAWKKDKFVKFSGKVILENY